MPPLEPSDEERLQQLPEDGQSPFSAATTNGADNGSGIDSTHPATDSNVQPEEIYEAGLADAAGASEPNASSAVVDYHPEDDQRQS